jgi:hypothetical protein
MKKGDLVRVACRNLISHLDLQPMQKVDLTKMFDCTLAHDSLHRVLDMRQVKVLLDGSLSDPSGLPSEMIPTIPDKKVNMKDHYNFQVHIYQSCDPTLC